MVVYLEKDPDETSRENDRETIISVHWCNLRRLYGKHSANVRMTLSIGSLCWVREWCVYEHGEMCGTRGNYLSTFVSGRAITHKSRRVPRNQLSYARCSPVFFLHKMSFEDVEERDGVQFVHSRLGGFVLSFFQVSDCRGTFGLRLALRPTAP